MPKAIAPGITLSSEGDIVVKCCDCGGDFDFTAGEQEFYAARGFTAPKRCKECRAVNKSKLATRNAAAEQRRAELAKRDAHVTSEMRRIQAAKAAPAVEAR